MWLNHAEWNHLVGEKWGSGKQRETDESLQVGTRCLQETSVWVIALPNTFSRSRSAGDNCPLLPPILCLHNPSVQSQTSSHVSEKRGHGQKRLSL